MLSSDGISLLFQARGDTAQAQQAFKDLEKEIKKDTDSIKGSSEKLSSGFASSEKNLQSIGSRFKSIGSDIQNFGKILAASITVPLTAIGGFAVKAALDIDKIRNKYIALEGSVDKANAKINDLAKLSEKSVGVNLTDALDNFAQLSAIGGIAEQNINKVIQSVGKLSTAFDIGSQREFMQNLGQIFNQDFERQDIKQALGRVPIFEQLLEKAFGTKDAEKLRELKKSGKLTLDAFVGGFADAVESDPRLAGLQETLYGKFAKTFDQIRFAVEPLGKVILDSIIPFIPTITEFIKTLSENFSNLSPTMKQIVVGIGAVAAVLPPIIIGIGAVVSAVGSIIAAAPTIGLVTAAIAGLAIAFAPLIAWSAALYAAWQTNFGGIRDLTEKVAEFIKTVWNASLSEIQSFTSQILNQITQFWTENGEDIKRAVQTVSEFIKSVWQKGLEQINVFWKSHGSEIKAIISAAWEAVKSIVSAGINYILNVVKLIAAVINGDWSKAWEAVKSIVSSVFSAIGAIIKAGIVIAANALKGIVTFLAEIQVSILQKAIEIGKAIISGIVNAIKSGASSVYNSIGDLATNAITSAKNKLGIQSPSKEFYKIGKNIVEGLIDGVNALRASAGQAILDLLQIPDAKNLTKKDAKGAEFLTSLLNQLAGQNLKNETQKVELELTKSAYAGINAQLREAIINTAKKIDLERQAIENQEKLKKAADDLKEVEKSNFDLEIAKLDYKRKSGEISEKDYIDQLNQKKIDALLEEKKQIEAIAETEENRVERTNKLTLIKNAIQKQDIENLARINDYYDKQGELLDKLFEKYNIVLPDQKNELQKLNELLSDKDVTEAIKERAAALGMTAEHLKSIILSAANGTTQTAGDREGGSPAGGDYGGGGSPIESLFGGILGKGNVDVMQQMGEALTQTMNGLADAAGNAVEAFIKFGSVGGNFRKFAAEMIAMIAKMAVVQAVWNLAEGFAKLALAYFGHPTAGLSATQHFIAAGIYASIAGVAAIAGRAVAGNEFQKQSSSAAAGFSQTGTGGNISNNSNNPTIFNQGINHPSERVFRIVLEPNEAYHAKIIKETFTEGSRQSGSEFREAVEEVMKTSYYGG